MTTENSNVFTRAKGSKTKVSADIKNQILERVKTSGKPIKEIAEEHGVATGTIYSWLEKDVGTEVTKREFMEVQKENKQLKELLGELTLKMSVSQKKQW